MTHFIYQAAKDHPILKTFGIAMLTIALAYLGGRYIGATGMPAFMNLVNLALGGALGLAVLIKPHFGLVFLVATLPITALMPSIPIVSGLSVPLGAATIAGYVIQHRWGKERAPFRLQWIHITAALFIIWLFVSNPSAAVLRGDRNWLLTFGQLIILVWLAGMLLQPASRQRQVLFFFALASTISAAYAIYDSPVWQQADVMLREQRSGGLAGINAGARYFVVALVALYYLHSTTTQRLLRLLGVAAMLILLLGVIVTGSRTGLLLLPVALAFIVIGRRGQGIMGRLVAMVAVSALALLVVPQSYWQILEDMARVTQAGIEGEDIRAELWQAGIAMWREHPLEGVGVGQFPVNLPDYARGNIPADRLSAGPHSIYFGLLAETGAIGLLLFLALCGVTLHTYWRASTRLPTSDAVLAYTWFTMLLIMLVGGLTKHDQYEKLIWFLIGMATVFGTLLKLNRTTDEEADAMSIGPGG